MPIRRWGVSGRLALVAVILSTVVGVVTAVGAWRLDPLPSVTPADTPELPFLTVPERHRPAPRSVVIAAVAKDPFRADRTRPTARYQLPSDRFTGGRTAAVPRPRLPTISLVGVALLSDGKGLAAVRVRGSPPRLLRIGDNVEGLVLLHVDPGSVTLTGQDTTIVLRLPRHSGGGPSP